MAGGGGEGDGGSVEQAAGAQQRVALAEVAARPADVGARHRRLAHAQRVAATLGVFLDDDAVGALRDAGAREDAHRLTGSDRPGERAAGVGFADDAQARRDAGEVGGARGVAVHGGGVERRLRQRRRHVCG
jgi:hypothetical protein